ncbi:MAG: DNA polymerase IV, partial [Thermoplasmata archaeon]|nr:DNA polymerase IV [Thermoplasmata archaeon]
MQWLFYVDMDAFYVSCELRERPELRGQPVLVGHRPTAPRDRGVVLAASYEARAFGVRSAMPSARALELLPNAQWVAPDFARYSAASQELRSLLAELYGEVHLRSIDEAIVVAELPDADAARSRAAAIQSAIDERLHLPASIGVSPHEVVAKIASDRAKPQGILVVAPEATEAFLSPLPVRAIPGVGPKAEATLQALGIRTIGELRTAEPGPLRRN